MRTYNKALVAVVMAALVAVQTLAADGGLSVQDWCSIAVAVLTAVGVYLVDNVGPLGWAKTAVAMLLAGAQAAVQLAGDGVIAGQEWLTIAIAVLGVISVYAVPIKPTPSVPAWSADPEL